MEDVSHPLKKPGLRLAAIWSTDLDCTPCSDSFSDGSGLPSQASVLLIAWRSARQIWGAHAKLHTAAATQPAAAKAASLKLSGDVRAVISGQVCPQMSRFFPCLMVWILLLTQVLYQNLRICLENYLFFYSKYELLWCSQAR